MKKGNDTQTAAAPATQKAAKAEGPVPATPPPPSPPPTAPEPATPPPNGQPAAPQIDPALAPAKQDRAAPTLAAAKLRIMAACPYLQKRTGEGLKYTFASEADLINLLRPALLANHVVITPAGCEMVANEQFTTGKGSVMRRVVVKMTYRFTHVPSRESEEVQMFGEGADVGDKAVNKAMTGALKYALRQWMLVETGDDPDTTDSASMAMSPEAAAPPLKKIDPAAQAAEAILRRLPAEQRDSYVKCETAINRATDRKQLDTYRDIYRHKRGFDKETVASLDLVYLARLDALNAPAGQPA